jgi:hypothetical protein
MTDGELADLIHELSNELEIRCSKIKGKNWLYRQLDISSLMMRSYSTTRQRNLRCE